MRRSAEQILSRRGWLARQPKPFRQLVLSQCQLLQFDHGASIYHQGDLPGGIYGIVSGAIAVSIAPGETGPHFAHLARPGAWIGEAAFFTGEPRRVALEAATESVLMHLPLQAMKRMASKDADAIRRFGQIAISNFDTAVGVVNDLMIPEPARRIAAVLVRSAGAHGEPKVDLSQAELGILANASRKLVNQALKRFAASRWVMPGYGMIAVLDVAALEDFAAGKRS